MRISNGPLAVAMKLKTKYIFHTPGMFFFLFDILQNKIYIFLEECYHISFQLSKLHGANVASTKQVSTSAILLLLLSTEN
jgi:O-acetyl-ADP-ribose deacetylase (regulator of RNase III)